MAARPDSTESQARPVLMQLHPDDNVLIVARHLQPGDSYTVAGEAYEADRELLVGSKVAGAPISAGAQVLRLSVPIGIATRDIAIGDFVHMHNLASQRQASTTRLEGQ